jgi:hypothetical protein
VATLKAYKLHHVFFVSEAQTQWDKMVQEMHTKAPWVGIIRKLYKGLHTCSWMSFQDRNKLHKLTVFSADATVKQHFYIQQTTRKSQHVNVHQYMSHMGILNDYLAYLPTVYDLSMAVEVTKKAMCPSMWLIEPELYSIWYRSPG